MVKKPSIPEEEPEDYERVNYAKGFFDDGIVYKWVEGITPRHIRFEVQAQASDIESCAVHFYNLE